MPNDTANNMADTIHFLEEENASLMRAQVDLQLAYNDLMIELREAKRLLKLAVEDFAESLGAMYTCTYCKYHHSKRETCAERKTQCCGGICKWRYADEVKKLLGDETNGS